MSEALASAPRNVTAPVEAQDEASRLVALDALDLLDTPPEQGFDTITGLVRKIFDVKIAYISAIDAHRQWYKSCVGIAQGEFDRKVTFCDLTIRQHAPLIVSDASRDPRFVDNLFVTGPAQVRFYAGVPLTTSDGQDIGTLCAVDDKPREFSDADLTILLDLGRVAMEMMELRQSAAIDALTGLMSRQGFRREAERVFALARRHKQAMSCLMVDVDHFKKINDTYGHPAGDKVLAGVARACLEDLRQTDAVGRMGGEEFAVLLPLTDAEGALGVAEKIRKSIQRKRFELSGVNLGVTASIGVASIASADGDFDAMLARADAALYKAKQAGRNRALIEASPQSPDQRRRVLKAGQIVFRNGISGIDCTVRSLGEHGAGLDVISTVGIPDEFRLLIRADRFEADCSVSARTERHLEVRFA